MSNTHINSAQQVFCQTGYVRTVPGILKIIELVCDVLSLIFGLTARNDIFYGHKVFFIFASTISIIITSIIFIFTLLNITTSCFPDRWVIIEMFICAFLALLFFIASVIIATIAIFGGVYGAAAFFGFAAFITYTADGINRARMRQLECMSYY